MMHNQVARVKKMMQTRKTAVPDRSEAGDTLIEVLMAIVILGLASVAVMLAFATSISGSSVHRNLATMDTVLRTAAEETIMLTQQQPNSAWGTCSPAVTNNPTTNSIATRVSATLPSGWKVQLPAAGYSTKYWTPSDNPPDFTTLGCVPSTVANPQVNSPLLVTITVTSPAGVVSDPLGFVIDDPSSRPVPAAGPATHLAFLTSPSSTTAGSALAVQVAVEDANNNDVTSDFSAVTLTITPNTGTSGASLSNTCSGQESNGVITFSGCTISTIGTGYTLTATDREINTTTGNALTPATSSPPFNITAAPVSQLAFTPETPGPGTAGSAIPSVTVQAEDSVGNLVSTATGSVTVAIQSGSPQSSFSSGTTTVALSHGIATFSTLVVNTSGTYVLTASPVNVTGGSGTISPDTTNPFVVSPAGPSSLSVSNPGNQTVGSSFSDTIIALDAYGNIASSATGTYVLTFSGPSNSPNGTAPVYPPSVTFTAGVGTASGITLFDPQSTRLTVTYGSFSASSGTFTVSTGLTPTTFVLSTPATQKAGVSFTDSLTATDDYGNTITGYSGSKAVSFSGPSNGPGGTAPVYPASVTFSSGAGTASGIILYNAQATSLTATQGSVSGSSGTFAVTPAAASKLAFNPAAPGPGSAGSVIPNVAVQVLDTYGNLTTVSSGSVTMTIKSGGPQTTFSSGTAAISVSAGTATFSNLVVNTAGTYTLTAAPASITGVTSPVNSSSFTVAKATPTNVVSNSSPTTLGSTVTFTATVAGPTGSTTPTGTVTWSVSGTAGSSSCTSSTTTLSGGTATCAIAIANAGTYIVSDSYSPGSDLNYLAATSATDTVSVGFTPNVLQIEGKSGGIAGKIVAGNHIGVTFPVAVTAASICPGKTTTFSITGTATIQSNAASGTNNDELIFAPNSGQCTGNVTGFASGGSGTHAGYIDLGSPNFVTSSATVATSTLKFNATTNNIQLTLGATVTGGGTLGTVGSATGTYFPDSAIQSATGVAVSGSVTSSTVFTVLQPTGTSIASVTGTANGIPGSGDQAVYTFNEQVDPDSILTGWTGGSTAIEACFTRTTGSTLLTIATSSTCASPVDMGSVNLGDSGTFYVASNSTVPVAATMSMATVGNSSVVTVALTATGSFNAVTANTQWTWTPTALSADFAGNPLSTTATAASPSKRNFSKEAGASETAFRRGRASFRKGASSFRLLEHVIGIVIV
jgi:Tfp pilus assembly protein PilV